MLFQYRRKNKRQRRRQMWKPLSVMREHVVLFYSLFSNLCSIYFSILVACASSQKLRIPGTAHPQLFGGNQYLRMFLQPVNLKIMNCLTVTQYACCVICRKQSFAISQCRLHVCFISLCYFVTLSTPVSMAVVCNNKVAPFLVVHLNSHI